VSVISTINSFILCSFDIKFDKGDRNKIVVTVYAMNRPCHTRITNKNFQYFADGVHKFYLEFCCERPCLDGRDRCTSCIKIHPGARSQFDSTYPHGHMSEPIPDHSHIFGGSWYQHRVQQWGEPSLEVIALAQQHQREARKYTPVSKAKIASISQDMARKKVVEAEATVAASLTTVETVAPVKKPRKPRVATATAVEIPIVTQVEQVAQATQATQAEQVKPIKVPKPKKAAKASPKVESVPVQETRICKEVVIPTYIEQQIEEIDTNDYEIEYVPLTFIDIDHTTYFRDPKNKLYQKIKEKIIGPYVGRYCPHTESICTEIPDSDEENDS
jgi:hypothetical protein